jgi:hypothetical protein
MGDFFKKLQGSSQTDGPKNSNREGEGEQSKRRRAVSPEFVIDLTGK